MKQPNQSTDRWMDRRRGIYAHSGVPLRSKEQRNKAAARTGPGDCAGDVSQGKTNNTAHFLLVESEKNMTQTY